MVVQLRPRAISVDRGSRGFGLSLIYRGLDKYEEQDTGIFVARVVPGGQAARYGVKENDKIMTINGQTPRNVGEAVGVIKGAGNQIKLVVLREEDVLDTSLQHDDTLSLTSQDVDSKWMQNTLGISSQPISRSGSARSFNTTYGRGNSTPSPHLPTKSPIGSQSPGVQRQNEFLRQQAEYRKQQRAQQDEYQRQQVEAALAARNQDTIQRHHHMEQQQHHGVKDQVREMIHEVEEEFRPKSPGRYIMDRPLYGHRSKSTDATKWETKKSMENITKIVESIPKSSNKYKSTNSLHELGIDNYPNPDMPESSRLTRKEEKMSLQNLNNRLASYIDRVRQLQNENNRLSHQIKTVEEHQTKEINNVKDLYDKQSEDLREALDHMNKQYNQLKVGAEGLLQENQDLKDKVSKRDNDVRNHVNHIAALEDEIRGLGNKMSTMESDSKRMEDELNEALPELRSLRERLAETKRLLDDETLKKANLDNKCARLEEDLKFKMAVLEKELTEVKTRKEIEITEIDDKLQEEYENRLQKALEELREVYDKQMAQSRDDFTRLYEDRVRDLQTALSKERGSNTTSNQEIKESRNRIESLLSKVSDLEGANLSLNQKISDMAREMDDLKSSHRAQINAKNSEIEQLLEELSNQMKEYQNLQDIKVALDMEIAVFRSLIECEEDRLGLGEKTIEPTNGDDTSLKRTVERRSQNIFQKKITVSQTQL